MKVLYISYPYFFDMDLSLIQSFSTKADLYYLLDLPVFALNMNALEIKNQPAKPGIYNASVFAELAKFGEFINLEKTSVISRVSKKVLGVSNLKLQSQIKKFIKDLNPDVIHCNGFLSFDFFAFLVSNKISIVQTIHDPFPHSGENSYRDFAVRRFNYSFIRKKILLNFKQKETFIKRNNFKESNVFISSLGPYTHLARYATRNGSSKTNNILFFGRISPYKGIEYLIRAVNQLKDEIPDIKLTIAGQGEFWFDTSEINNSKNFRIINDFIRTPQLVELLNETELVVCPYTDATQSGVIMTAFAFCKPVVATNVGGLAEMIDDGITGKLVNARNVEQLAGAIRELLTDKQKLEEYSQNIRSLFFEGSRSWDKKTDELVGIYQKVISA
jgi:glycosyltransferase involved in cell wall biosynthesis